ncbi:MAG TPA: hypothetical protein VHX37_03995 [Acidobacteriaceae bacterium]|jgi:hypothetical protein|nr:hypothetical protein [Acidobacteriaceae bacterium]
MNPGNIPRLDEIGINGAVLAFTFGLALATGVLFGLAPAWRVIRLDANSSLKAGGRSGQSDGGLYMKRHRLRGLLVISEITLPLILLIGARLLIRSFIRLQRAPPGFTTDHVLTMEVVANGSKYHDEAERHGCRHLPGGARLVGRGGIRCHGDSCMASQQCGPDGRASGGIGASWVRQIDILPGDWRIAGDHRQAPSGSVFPRCCSGLFSAIVTFRRSLSIS